MCTTCVGCSRWRPRGWVLRGSSRRTATRCRPNIDLMRSAITEGRVVSLLDHDEALLTILYNAAGNPVLSK